MSRFCQRDSEIVVIRGLGWLAVEVVSFCRTFVHPGPVANSVEEFRAFSLRMNLLLFILFGVIISLLVAILMST